MLGCTETVTLIRHIKQPQGDAYDCVVIRGASWFAKTETVNTVKGITTGNVLKCRILPGSLPESAPPCVGDYMVHGDIDALIKLSDLLPFEHFRITAVGDNRRGRLKHWLVTGS